MSSGHTAAATRRGQAGTAAVVGEAHSALARLVAGAATGVALLLAAAVALAQPMPGQIVVDDGNPRWFRYHGGGPFFMAGPGDPEGFLYRGKLRPDGTRDGDQAKLIAKLAGSGANSIYLMAVRSHGGDGEESHNPFVGHDPARGLNQAARNVNNANFIRQTIQPKPRKAQVNGHFTLFFFFQTVGVKTGQRLNKRRLAMIYMTGSTNDIHGGLLG